LNTIKEKPKNYKRVFIR